MTGGGSGEGADRVAERRRAVALARHYREFEGLSIRQIADHLGRSPATVKVYFYDPTGEKARAVKARYQGVCRGCGAYTQPRNDKGDAYAYCKACHPGAVERRWGMSGCVWRALRAVALVLRLVHARAGVGEMRSSDLPKRAAISERRYLALRNVDRRLRSGAASGGGRPSGTDLMRSQRSAGSLADADWLATERSRIWRIRGKVATACDRRSLQR